MDANEYQRLAMRIGAPHDRPEHRLLNAALGLAGEAGELADDIDASGDPLANQVLHLAAGVGLLADRVKKARYHGHPLDYDALCALLDGLRATLGDLALVIGMEETMGAPPASSPPLVIADVPRLAMELGDVQWYVAQAADALGVELGAVMQANVEKLRRRYAEGFSAAASLRRED